MKYYNEIEKQLVSRLGTIQEISKIQKGFSDDEKFVIKTAFDTYLLRISSAKTFSRKKEEFKIMKKLFAKGVNCNKPIDIFTGKEDNKIYNLFSFLPGNDAEKNISKLAESTQFEIGFYAGQDLKTINSLENSTSSWKKRKLAKHEFYLAHYLKNEYSFENDDKLIKFIESNCDRIKSAPDRFQHDDFHLGNIIINDSKYSGILDFNRYDRGDPLHEFVKLEWFTWPVSKEFARGEIKGYFGNEKVSEDICLIISVYIAMSIFSTIVWTLQFHPKTMPFIENRMKSILDNYEYFDRIRPEWISGISAKNQNLENEKQI
ncbi:MAG: aminoglycoside phosphotransferase family protein [Desulfococcaceae bacterium]|jgi:aminoglycoside phosphotransferase (APT) family kinase protein|nr:aminoglycoside phosphotransferase family protein [Desulfococcaceae bacterium]